MKLTIIKHDDSFEVDDKSAPGMPPVGRGRTMLEAIGSWLHNNQERMGIEFELEGSVVQTEERRRQRELSKR
jgi:hypothetical protein